MELKLQREPSTAKSTPGKLYIDGVFQCFTIEDVVRPEKIAKITAIPAGRYEVIITMSARFKRELPLLKDVPNYTGVRIHPGNTSEDTEGCILPGAFRPDLDHVTGSRVAFDALFAKLKDGLGRGPVFIEVRNG